MANWLERVTELIGIKTKSELMTRFVEMLVAELSLSNCMVLTPSSEGRRLAPHNAHSGVALMISIPLLRTCCKVQRQ